MFSIFFLVFAAVALAMGLAIFITRTKLPGQQSIVPPEDPHAHDASLPALRDEHMFRVGEKLCAEAKLVVKDRLENSTDEVYWVAESQDEFFYGTYVLAFIRVTPDHPFSTMTDVLEFKDFIKSVGGTKGLFFTSGYFTKDVYQPLEGPKVSLYNKPKILEEMARLKVNP